MCASSANCVFIQISETAKHSASNLLSVHIIYIYMSVSSLHKRCRWVLSRDVVCHGMRGIALGMKIIR